MYAVVGCSDCSALWVVEGRPETTQCPRCGARRKYPRLKKFVTTEDAAHAKQVRAAMLADRQGESDAFAELDDFAAMDAQLDAAGVDEETYLDEHGIDPDAVAEAGERASQGQGGSSSREEIVRAALSTLEEPTMDELVAYGTEHGLDASTVERLVEKLHRAGELTESRGIYRLV